MTQESDRQVSQVLKTHLRRVASYVGKEGRRGPLATLAAAIVIFGAVSQIFLSSDGDDEELRIQNHPFDISIAQWTPPSFVVPGTVPADEVDRLSGARRTGDEIFTQALKDIGAVRAERLGVGFFARSDLAEPSIVLSLRVEVLRRDEPVTGTWLIENGGGKSPARILYADLDQDPPVVRIDGSWTFPLHVSSTDVEEFVVMARAETCHCQWQIELDYLAPTSSEVETVIVDDDGTPFEVTGTTNANRMDFEPWATEAVSSQ